MPRVSVTLSRSGSHSDSGIPMYPQIGDWTQLIQLAILETYPQNDATLWLQQHSNMAESRAWRLQARVCCKRFTLRHIQLLTQRLEQRLVVRAASSRFSKVVGKVFKSVGGYVRRFNRSLNDLIFQYYFIYIYFSVLCGSLHSRLSLTFAHNHLEVHASGIRAASSNCARPSTCEIQVAGVLGFRSNAEGVDIIPNPSLKALPLGLRWTKTGKQENTNKDRK